MNYEWIKTAKLLLPTYVVEGTKEILNGETNNLRIFFYCRAITTQERDYVTKEELYHNLTKEMADYCIKKMKNYVDPRTGQEVNDAYDYMEFTRTLFQS